MRQAIYTPEDMTIQRALVLYGGAALAWSPVIVLAQQHAAARPDTALAQWLNHPNFGLIILAAMAGGVLEIVIGAKVEWFQSPRSIYDVMQRFLFDVVCAIFLLPWALEAWAPNLSVAAVGGVSLLATMLAPQIMPAVWRWAAGIANAKLPPGREG